MRRTAATRAGAAVVHSLERRGTPDYNPQSASTGGAPDW